MNKLITPNGGMPLELDDLRFMQDAYHDGFKGIIYEFAKANNGNIILGGCEVVDSGNGTFEVSEGYIMLDYEVLYVPAVTGLSFSLVILEYNQTYDPAGNEVFADNTSRDTYEVRQARVFDPNISQSPNSRSFTIDNSRRIETIIGNKVGEAVAQQDAEGVRYDFVAADFPAAGGYAPSVDYPPYAIKKQGRVQLYGEVIPPNSPGFNPATGGNKILTLPTGFRKSSSDRRANVFLCALDEAFFKIGLDPTELIAVGVFVPANNEYTGQTGYGISLAGISFDVD